MKEELGMTYHKALIIIEAFLSVTALTSFITSFETPFSTARTIAQVFYIVELVLLMIGILRHSYKDGVYWFLGWGIIELVYQCVTLYAYASMGFTTVEQALINGIMYAFTTALFLVPTYLYYKKRKALLKS